MASNVRRASRLTALRSPQRACAAGRRARVRCFMGAATPVSVDERPRAGTPERPSPLPVDGRALDHSLLRGIAWTGAMRWGTQLLSWASTVIVARLLAPTDYGLVGMAAIYLGFVQLVNEFGLGAAIVTRRDLNEDQIARLGGFALLLGCGFVGVSGVVAAPMATFFHEPPVRWVVLVSSL